MGVYPNPLYMKAVPGGYKLMGDFVYWTSSGKKITAPKGFVTDLASVPRIFRPIFTGHGKSRQAACIHDWLYHNFHHTRKEADQIFLEALKTSGMNWFGRRAMYRAVRLGGWMHYRSKES